MRERRGLLSARHLVVCLFLAPLCVTSGWTDSAILRWSGNGHYYQLVSRWLSWPEAQAAAEARGGYLVTITSQAEQDWVTEQFVRPGMTMCWIGLYQDQAPFPGAWAPDEHWNWVTGEPVVYTNWRPAGPKEPNDAGPPEDNHENYGHITDINGFWNDLQAAWYTFIAYLVEWDSDPLAPAPPTLSWPGAEGYRNDGVDPDAGSAMATSFRFRVIYRDVNGDPPHFVNLLLRRVGSSGPPRELGMSRGEGEGSTGVVYRRTLKLRAGEYECRFEARDRDGWATGEPTQWRNGPTVEAPPALAWVGSPGYESDGVDPDHGPAHDILFTFRVLYAEASGDEPLHVDLLLRRSGTPGVFRQAAMLAGPGSFEAGVVYRRSLRLPPGTYAYRFAAQDEDARAIGPPTEWITGPVIDPVTDAAFTGLAAIPNGAGVQLTFTLAAAAQVQARILNLAGRPVRTLCSARACEAGVNTLVWNAQSDNGLRVPTGTYLAELVAETPEGAQSRALTAVTVRR